MSDKLYMPNGERLEAVYDDDLASAFYARHVFNMTSEKLHSKSDIAAELAWRDAQIARLKNTPPEGYVLVPVELSDDVAQKFIDDDEHSYGKDIGGRCDVQKLYSMLIKSAAEVK